MLHDKKQRLTCTASRKPMDSNKDLSKLVVGLFETIKALRALMGLLSLNGGLGNDPELGLKYDSFNP